MELHLSKEKANLILGNWSSILIGPIGYVIAILETSN